MNGFLATNGIACSSAIFWIVGFRSFYFQAGLIANLRSLYKPSIFGLSPLNPTYFYIDMFIFKPTLRIMTTLRLLLNA